MVGASQIALISFMRKRAPKAVNLALRIANSVQHQKSASPANNSLTYC